MNLRQRKFVDYKNCIKVLILDYDETIKIRNKELHPHIPLILKSLNEQGYLITLASLNMNAPLRLYDDNIYNFFDMIQYRRHYKNHDKKYMFRNIMNHFDIEPHECLLFDDNLIHCKEALKLGINYIHIDDTIGLVFNDIKHLL